MIEKEEVQKIHESHEVECDLEYYKTSEDEAKKILKRFKRPFDLGKPPFLRVGLINIGENVHILIIDMHHIFADAISQSLLFYDLMALYAAEELPSLRIQYRDFSEWQNHLFDLGGILKQEQYWLNRFKGSIPVLKLPTDDAQASVEKSHRGKTIGFLIEEELTGKLSDFVKETETTLYIVLLAVCNILLFKYTQQEDIIVGSPITGRMHVDMQGIVGMFVNLLAMRNQPTGNKTFREFLGEVKENALNAFANQEYQFEELVRKLGLQGNTSRNPLFNVVFAVLNINIDTPVVEFPGLALELRPYPFEKDTSKFDLRLAAQVIGNTISMTLTYATGFLKEKTAQRMTERYMEIIKQVLIINRLNHPSGIPEGFRILG
jgi:hypothetical protein